MLQFSQSAKNKAPFLELSLPTDAFEVESEEFCGLKRRTFADIKVSFLSQCDASEPNPFIQHTDLIRGDYEGGFKTWECCIDLVEYLKGIHIQGSVLELGCGGGLPGIYCLLQGAQVDFQDYNEQVLLLSTIPNIYLNMEKDNAFDYQADCLGKSRFYCGDWEYFTSDKTYDFILTSETIYDSESIESLVKVLVKYLKPNGVALVAAKTNYFGLSGSIPLFKKVAQQHFKIKTVFSLNQNVFREILELTK